MDYTLILAISVAIYLPLSIIWSGYRLLKRWRAKRQVRLLKKIRRNLR